MVSGIAKKFQLKSEFSVLMLNSNPDVHPLFDGIRLGYSAKENTGFDSVIMFVRDEYEIGQYLPKADSSLKPKGLLWLSYPKKSGSIPSKLNRDVTWSIVKEFDLEPVRLISLNDDWSSMRLVKTTDRKKPSTFGQDPPGVDRVSKTVIPPEDLQKALTSNRNATFFLKSLHSAINENMYPGFMKQKNKKRETEELRKQSNS